MHPLMIPTFDVVLQAQVMHYVLLGGGCLLMVLAPCYVAVRAGKGSRKYNQSAK